MTSIETTAVNTPAPAVLQTPSLPASTVVYTNDFGRICLVTVSGGVVTVISVSGVTSGLLAGTFVLQPAGTIAITYASAPTWTWTAL